MKHHQEILGLKDHFTEEELKQAFRTLSRKCHPDLNGNTKESVDKFNILNDAYTVLKAELKDKFAIFGIKPTKNADDLQVAFRKIVDDMKARITAGDEKAESEMKSLSEKYNQLQAQLLAEAEVEW